MPKSRFKEFGIQITTREGRVAYTVKAENWTDAHETLMAQCAIPLFRELLNIGKSAPSSPTPEAAAHA